MPDKPKRASEYEREQVDFVRATCLYVATKLGDMMNDLVIVGGLVPSLIVDQSTLPADADAHVGTMDLDLGLQLALLDEGRYRKLTERLRDAGFAMHTNEAGNPTRQRWVITGIGTVTVDFLIQPSLVGDTGGSLLRPAQLRLRCPRHRCEAPTAPWRCRRAEGARHPPARLPRPRHGGAEPRGRIPHRRA